MTKRDKITENLDKIKELVLEVFPDVKQVTLYGKEEGYRMGVNDDYLCTLKAEKGFRFVFKKFSQ